MRVIKNPTRTNVETIFRGRKVSLPGKHSKIYHDYEINEEERAEYQHLMQIYGFLIDITVIIQDRLRQNEK